MAWKRESRPHWLTGNEQRLIAHPEHLTEEEQAECPPGLVQAFHAWPTQLEALPPELQWASGGLSARVPILERSVYGGGPGGPLRTYWALRYALHGNLDRLKAPCLGSVAGGVACSAPGAYGWLAQTFGAVNLNEEESGTAPWGQRLGQVDPERMFDGAMDALPSQAKDWWVLYERDGDWVAWDSEQDAIHWTGAEWTGHPDLRMAAPAQRAIRFVFWRLLDAKQISPTDLEMLGGP